MYHHRQGPAPAAPPPTAAHAVHAAHAHAGGYASSNSSRISYADGSSTAAHSLAGLSAVSVGSTVVGFPTKAKVPAQGILRLHVLRAESLPHVHLSATTGPYLAVRYGNGKPAQRHKTRIQNAGGVNPTWNEDFELYVSSADVRKQAVLFTVKNKKVSSSVGGRSGSGRGADDDSRSILSTITGGGSSSVLGVANVKLLSLCAKERTLLIPLRRVGNSKPAGCIKVCVSFEAWNNAGGRSSLGVGVDVGVGIGSTPGNAGHYSTRIPPVHRLQHQAKQQLMVMPQPLASQPPHHQPHGMHRRPSAEHMLGLDQRENDVYGGGASPVPPPPPAPPLLPFIAPRGSRSGLPPRGPSLIPAGRNGGGYRRLLEESLEDATNQMVELVDTTPAYRRSAAKTSRHLHRSGGGNGGGDDGNGQRSSSRNHHRGGGHRRHYRSSGGGRERRRDQDTEDRDDTVARRDDVPSMVDIYDDDHSAIDSEVSTDHPHRGSRRTAAREERWGRVHHASSSSRPRAYANPRDTRDALVTTSKFLCF
mmetsp:Transcript_2770/g.8142  ORF Transcript_2770/g.8142 Transcript_2770/m.8142 type:complete len:533 (+) Transcript_2770:313-1911(+)|eukprot:CAMPEP_0181027946 /NCGR_PEP_ID=MMETSP1070-20121207/4420_1 /TAXON_ID=265543 /ORGANISM="Minutocellus polymorphus, Strain NH13" /LENGTH=532 /DNA_ID=CAMNT_0023105191 /DNA_START=282 /DNA_END=1880 /DNA_ORIENTATION=+